MGEKYVLFLLQLLFFPFFSRTIYFLKLLSFLHPSPLFFIFLFHSVIISIIIIIFSSSLFNQPQGITSTLKIASEKEKRSKIYFYPNFKPAREFKFLFRRSLSSRFISSLSCATKQLSSITFTRITFLPLAAPTFSLTSSHLLSLSPPSSLFFCLFITISRSFASISRGVASTRRCSTLRVASDQVDLATLIGRWKTAAFGAKRHGYFRMNFRVFDDTTRASFVGRLAREPRYTTRNVKTRN